jgi:hypothetical protein
MSIDAVFDEDNESAIVFCENMYIKNEIVKYECILACIIKPLLIIVIMNVV